MDTGLPFNFFGNYFDTKPDLTLEEAQAELQRERVYSAEQYVKSYVPEGVNISDYGIREIGDKHYVFVSWFDGSVDNYGEVFVNEVGEQLTRETLYELQEAQSADRILPDCDPLASLCLAADLVERIAQTGSAEVIKTYLYMLHPSMSRYAHENVDVEVIKVDEENGTFELNGEVTNQRNLISIKERNKKKRKENRKNRRARALKDLKEFEFIKKSKENSKFLKNTRKRGGLSLRLNLNSDQINALQQSEVKGMLTLWIPLSERLERSKQQPL